MFHNQKHLNNISSFGSQGNVPLLYVEGSHLIPLFVLEGSEVIGHVIVWPDHQVGHTRQDINLV